MAENIPSAWISSFVGDVYGYGRACGERERARSGEREREPGRATAAAELGFGVGGENDGREKGERAAAPLTAVASNLAVNATVAGQNQPTSAQNHRTRAQMSKLPGIRS